MPVVPRLLSVVIPVFNESARLQVHLAEIQRWLDKIDVASMVVLVDDGSTDTTWEVCQALARESPNVRTVRFSRNFGKEAAILCGLREAPGDAVVVMDSDLQHPPSLLPEMVRSWLEDGYDVVEAKKERRSRESWLRRLGASLFYRIMRFLSGFEMAGLADYKLMSRKVVQAYVDLPERSRFFRGLVAWLGYRTRVVMFTVPDDARDTRWSFSHLARLAMSAVTSFSYIPLQVITMAGFLTFIFSVALGIQTLWMKFSGRAFEGFSTVILVQLAVGSVIMLSLGVIGEYLARIYDELKRRPDYVVLDRTAEQGRGWIAGVWTAGVSPAQSEESAGAVSTGSSADAAVVPEEPSTPRRHGKRPA